MHEIARRRALRQWKEEQKKWGSDAVGIPLSQHDLAHVTKKNRAHFRPPFASSQKKSSPYSKYKKRCNLLLVSSYSHF